MFINLYPATLLNLFISSNSFGGIFHLSTHSKITSSANKDCYTIPLGFGDFCFSYLTALARNLRTTLNKSNESGHPCLILDVREDAFSLSSLSSLVIYGFMLRYVPFMGIPGTAKFRLKLKKVGKTTR